MSDQNKYPLDEAFKDAFDGYEAEFSPSEMQADWQGVQSQLGTGAAATGSGVSAGTIISGIAGIVAVVGIVAYFILKDAEVEKAPVEQNLTEQVQSAKGSEKVHKVEGTEGGETEVVENNKAGVAEKEKAGAEKPANPIASSNDKDQSGASGSGNYGIVPGTEKSSQTSLKGNATGNLSGADKEEEKGPFVHFSSLNICTNSGVEVSVADKAKGQVFLVVREGMDINIGNSQILPFEKPGTHQKVFVRKRSDAPNDTMTPTFRVSEAPKAAFTHQIKNTAQAEFRNLSEGALLYRWHFGDHNSSSEASPTYIYGDTGTFKVQLVAVNSSGCTDTAEGVVKISGEVKVAGIPNTFTPNNDGYNDYFEIPIEGETYFDITIMDMNGKTVFRSTDKSNSWDGTDMQSGKPVQPSQFIYVLRYKLLGQSSVTRKTGSITLIRD